jgi:hypothetical protein
MGPRETYTIIIAALVGSLLLCWPQPAACQETEPSQPGYQLNRADEDYRYLREAAGGRDFWDPVKFVSLGHSGAWYLSLGGEARERYEYLDHPNWGADRRDSDGYMLQRYFLHADLHLGDRLRLFAQLQSSLENGRSGGPRPTDRDELDLHQAFVDLRFPLAADDSFTLRSGRQELAYGSQRLISVREGPNVRQSFDGFRGSYRAGELALDAFVTQPAQTKRYRFDDGTDHSQALWGLYSVVPLALMDGGKGDFYYLGLQRRHARFDQGAAREVRHSLGTRLWRTQKPLDYNFEFLYQWGSFGAGDIRAWTVASDTGYTAQGAPFSPRVGLKADIASGDRDPGNPDLQTFSPLFPKGAYFSENGLIGPANFINLNPSLELHLGQGLLCSVNWDFFWRESTRDGIYNNAVVPVRSGRGASARYIGSQPQLQLQWDLERHLSLVTIYAHFLAGPFLRESGPGEDVDYFSTWLTYKF